MKKATVTLISAAVVIMAYAGMSILSPSGTVANAYQTVSSPEPEPETLDGRYSGFDIQVLVNGYPLEEYAARGRHYVEALDGAEYELRVSNPLGVRVAVALSVDGLNTIDARRSSAWEASKWVIEPYQSITISGWQMSSSRARRFYFTTERDSYGAKLGEAANLGVISAVFFRENRPVVVVPPPRRPRDYDEERIESGRDDSRSEAPSTSRDGAGQAKTAQAAPRANDDYAATGIGRNVEHDVRWVNLDLQSRPAGEVSIRYEYRDALVRLGVFPRRYPTPDPLRRRERSTGFEGRGFSPEP
ncbi:MAG: hypothetical protein QOJ64_1796 [Acidobacteriota bacterium]|jgi:hypothetical protein|nr:hypothetical protein [Acidobacteriota bacterium]